MKKITLLFLGFALAFLCAGCASTKLAEGYDENTVKEKAESVVELFTQNDFLGIQEMVLPDIQDKLSAEVLEQAKKQLMPNAGEFESYTSEAVIGQTDSNTKEELATCVVIAKYENQSVTFTLVFNKNMQITGIHLK